MSKNIFKLTIIKSLGFLLVGAIFLLPLNAMACGFGNSGGSDYVPKRQAAYSSNQAASVLEPEQAKNIVTNHIKKLNPDLGIANVNDAGGFFEVEIINQNDEVIQLLGVDKYSGRLMLLN
jgi:hypothetical protein